MKKHYVKNLALKISAVILVVLFLFFLFSAIYFPSYVSKLSQTTQEYEIMNVNPNKDKPTFGIVQVTRNLESDEYISFFNPELGDTVFIKNFGGELFSCSGACFCSSDERRTSTLLTRSLSIVISSFSFIIASKMAEMSFHEHCLLEFADYCENDELESTVEHCTKSSQVDETEKEIEESNLEKREQKETTQEEIEEKDRIIYECEQECVPNNFIREGRRFRKTFKKPTEEIEKWTRDNGPCEKLKYKGTIDLVEVPEVFRLGGYDIDLLVKERNLEMLRFHAWFHFTYTFVQRFCEKMSKLPKSRFSACRAPVGSAPDKYSKLNCENVFFSWKGKRSID